MEKEKSSDFLLQGCAILSKKLEALAAMVDSVAALSCEVIGGDISLFGTIDTGDEYVDREAAAVARDMKGLLNGSNRVGKVKCDAIAKIPKLHGRLREAVKAVRSGVRLELNSAVKSVEEAVAVTMWSLLLVLCNVGEYSLLRAELNLKCDDIAGLSEDLKKLLEKCPSKEYLDSECKVAVNLVVEKDYVKFVAELSKLFESVWRVMVWEAVTAYIALQEIEKNEEMKKAERERKKAEKKEKVVVKLGKKADTKEALVVQKKEKGIRSLMKLIASDTMKEKHFEVDAGEGLESLENRVCHVEQLFDLKKEKHFEAFLVKVKEIVESNETRRLPKLPKGTREFSREQAALREQVFSNAIRVFKRHGAMVLDTPDFELRETLMGKYGEDSKLVFDLADQGGELLSLRYDLTVPFARHVAMNGLTGLKRYQIGKVHRRDKPSKGRFREFYQCDFDIAGQYEKMVPDCEVIKILTELLNELDVGDYEVKLNHRMLLDGVLETCGVPPEKFRTICSSIDKLDKQSFEQIKKEMVEQKGLSEETAEKIGMFVKKSGKPMELLSELKQKENKLLESALKDLEILFEYLEKTKCIDKVTFDLSLARGLDYYTGVIFEAVLKGTIQIGSVAAGGRYDNLIGQFGAKHVPAVGLSLGLERVFTIMEQQQKERNETIRATETQVLVSILGDNSSLALELTNELWDAGLCAEYMVSKRTDKHSDRAKELGVPFTVFVGEEALKQGVVKIRNMRTKEEKTVSRDSMVNEVQKLLS